MTASILVHLFKSDKNTLPTTQYGIFSEFVLSCIYRHHNERTQLKDLTLQSLQLPESIRILFLFLSELAYQGVMDDSVIFSSLSADVSTLGLLQGVESFVRRGKAVSYNFLHSCLFVSWPTKGSWMIRSFSPPYLLMSTLLVYFKEWRALLDEEKQCILTSSIYQYRKSWLDFI